MSQATIGLGLILERFLEREDSHREIFVIPYAGTVPTKITLLDTNHNSAKIAVSADRGSYAIHRGDLLQGRYPEIYAKLRTGEALTAEEISQLRIRK